MSDANEFLMSGGLKGVPFPSIGTTVVCRIIGEPEKRQVTNTKGEIQLFPSGDPVMQVVIAVNTDLRDPDNPQDTGDRSLYIKNRMLGAVREAVRAAGANGLLPGGVLTVSFIGEEPPKVRGNDPTKLYAAHYVAPPSAGNAALMAGNGGGAPVVAPHYPTGGPPAPGGYVYSPTAAAVTGGPPVTMTSGAPYTPPATAADPRWQPPAAAQHAAVSATLASAGNTTPTAEPPQPPAGVDPGMWARMSGEQRAAVIAATANLAPF